MDKPRPKITPVDWVGSVYPLTGYRSTDTWNGVPLSMFPLPPNVRRTDPVTSHEAAQSARMPMRKRIVLILKVYPDGLTDWELTRLLALPDRRKPSVAKRRQEVGAVPVLTEYGDTVTRLSPDGYRCIVWKLPTV